MALPVVTTPVAGAIRPDAPGGDRAVLLTQALHLEYGTVGWNLIEGVIAIGAALSAGSIALLGFGVDSFVESLSGGILIWRLKAEQRGHDGCSIAELDRKAHRLVAVSLFVLAAYILADSSHSLYAAEKPSVSAVGMVLAAVSMVVMGRLAKAKRRVAIALGSRAMEADAFQTTACWWLSVITLAGIGLNAALGWWWADPLAALLMTGLLVKEGREAWRGEDCCG